jgi:hypothetical protein
VAKTKPPYPKYQFYPGEHMGELTDDFVWQTRITNRQVKTPYASLSPSGQLVVFTGYRWDFGSGPAIDDVAMVGASLVHDCLCDFVKERKLPRRYQRKADKELRRALKMYGTSWWRRAYVYVAVRWWNLLKYYR